MTRDMTRQHPVNRCGWLLTTLLVVAACDSSAPALEVIRVWSRPTAAPGASSVSQSAKSSSTRAVSSVRGYVCAEALNEKRNETANADASLTLLNGSRGVPAVSSRPQSDSLID